MAHVIVVGNEKGGAGKSTLSVHIAVAACFAGFTVAALDLDRRQRTFARYFENRRRFADAHDAELSSPTFHDPPQPLSTDRAGAEKEEIQRTQELIASLAATSDIVLVDSPGADTPASRAAHAMADTILTPMNDSFVDFDLLAQVDPLTGEVQTPSIYAQMVFDARKAKALSQRKPIDWIVVRNRLSALEARNKRRVGDALATLATRIGFRVAPGLSERVIYREMFPSGLTLLDLTDEGAEGQFTMSHVAARNELRDLMTNLRLPILAGRELGF
jgi:chromosome partitioning protein